MNIHDKRQLQHRLKYLTQTAHFWARLKDTWLIPHVLSCKCCGYRARLQLSSPAAAPAQAFLVTVSAQNPALSAAVCPLCFGHLQADRAAASTSVCQREHSLRGCGGCSAKPQNPAKHATTELAALIVLDGHLLRQHLLPPSTQPEFLWNCVLMELLLISQHWFAGPLHTKQSYCSHHLCCACFPVGL